MLAALFLEWFLHLNSFYVVVREGGQVQVFFLSLLGLDGFLAQNNLPVTMAPLRQPALGSCPGIMWLYGTDWECAWGPQL